LQPDDLVMVISYAEFDGTAARGFEPPMMMVDETNRIT